MSDVSDQEFGIYKERTDSNTKAIASVSADIDTGLEKLESSIGGRLDKIDQKLDGVVSQKNFDEFVKRTDYSIENLKTRMTEVEDSIDDDKKSISSSIKKVFAKRSVDLIVNLIFIILGGAFVAYLLSQIGSLHLRPITVDETVQDNVREK